MKIIKFENPQKEQKLTLDLIKKELDDLLASSQMNKELFLDNDGRYSDEVYDYKAEKEAYGTIKNLIESEIEKGSGFIDALKIVCERIKSKWFSNKKNELGISINKGVKKAGEKFLKVIKEKYNL